MEVGAIFSMIAFLAGLLKFWLSDRLIEDLHLNGEVQRLHFNDWIVIGGWILLIAPIAILIDYPLELVPFLQGVLMIVLQLLFTTIPSYLTNILSVPNSTENTFVKTKVFVGTFALAFFFAHILLFGMRIVEFYL
jgi:hypothetical protein